MSTAEKILDVLEQAGEEVVSVVCPGCGAVVSLAEAVAKLLLAPPGGEAAEVRDAERAILDADAAAVAVAKVLP